MTALMIETVHIPYDPQPIIAARLSLDWTQKIAAERAGIHVATLIRIEGGGKVTSESLGLLCGALQIPIPIHTPQSEQHDKRLGRKSAAAALRTSSKERRRGPSSRHLVKTAINS